MTTVAVVDDGARSAVSWPAIFAGGVAAAAISLLLAALGAVLGLSAVSPWETEGASARLVSWGAGVYLVATAVIASALGGYIAGRLRVKWTGVEADEAFFRNTAHGLLAWSVATLLTAAVLASAAAGLTGAAISATGHAAAAARGMPADQVAGYVDRLLRAEPTAAAPAVEPAGAAAERAEIGRIVVGALRNRDAASVADDRRYAAQLVARRTGLPQAEAERRVEAMLADARAAADRARKADVALALFVVVSLFFGAFAASAAALEGGGLRDGTWRRY